MTNRYYNNTTSFFPGTTAKGDEVDDKFDGVTAGFDAVQGEVNDAIRLTHADITTAQVIADAASSRSNKVIGFDAAGALTLRTAGADWKGDWTTGTYYRANDIVRDTTGSISENSLFVCLTAHTAGASLLADTAKWAMMVDVAAVVAAQTAAEAAQTAAETAETNAELAATQAAASYDNFDDRYLGARASDPSTDNDGNALVTGALYWNTAAGEMRAWNGSTFVTVYNTVTSASQAEMETGTEAAIRSMSPLRVAQAIAAQSSFVGKGGAVVTDGVTLTATSSAAQAITPTYYDEVVTLPDATTMREGVPAFVIQNKSELFDLRVKDSAGTTLGWIRPLATGIIGLADNSTAAGNWITTGVEKLGVSAALEITGLSNHGSAGPYAIALDSNRTLLLPTSSTGYAVAHDASTNTYGSATLIAASSFNNCRAVLLSTDKVLVVYSNSGLGLTAVILSVSGTTITVGTPANSDTFTNGVTLMGAMEKLSSTLAVVSLGETASSIWLLAISVSGTTVTWGSKTASTFSYTSVDSAYPLVAVSSTLVLHLHTSGSTLTVKPWSVSGTTLTAGTAATLTNDTYYFRYVMLDTGRVLIISSDSSHVAKASIVNISGTTATLSTVTLTSGSFGAYVPTQCAIAAIASGKVLIAYYSTTGARFITLTDTSGTASVGTSLATIIDAVDAPFFVGMKDGVVTFANGTNLPALFNVTLTADEPTSVHHAGGFFTVATGTLITDGFAFDTNVFNRRTGLIRAGQAVYALNTIANNVHQLRYACGKISSVSPPDRLSGFATRSGCPTEGRNTDFWFFGTGGTALRLHRLEAVE